MISPKITSQPGQAAVESAIVLPLMLFLVLGVIQLAMLQHARLMTEYAAYNAVRSGIVWNGDQCMMRRAAVISLLPTLGATDTLMGTNEPFDSPRPGLIETWVKAQVLLTGSDLLGNILDWLGIGDVGFRLVDIEILNPTKEHLEFFREGKEMDFDVVAGVPDGPDFKSETGMREANILTARVTYLYPMRIPFANWTIFYSFLAHRADFSVRGGFFKPGLEPNTIVSASEIDTWATGTGLALIGGDIEGLDESVVVSTVLLSMLWQLGQTTGIYLFPLHAVHSMRMQSNFYVSSFESPEKCVF